MRLEAGHLVERHPDHQLEAQALPGPHRPARELGVGLDEALVEEDRREARARAHLVAEAEAQRGADDEGDQLLALAAALLPQRPVRRAQLAGEVVVALGADLDVAAYVEQPVAVGGRAAGCLRAQLLHEAAEVGEASLEVGLLQRGRRRAAGRQGPQLLHEGLHVHRREPPQPDPQPVAGAAELQSPEDGVDRHQPVLDLLDRGGHRPDQRHQVLPAPLGQPPAPLGAAVGQALAADVLEDALVVGVGVGGGTQVGRVPARLVVPEDRDQVVLDARQLGGRVGDRLVQPGLEPLGVLGEPVEVVGVGGRGGRGELDAQRGVLLVAETGTLGPLGGLEPVVDVVLVLDQLAVPRGQRLLLLLEGEALLARGVEAGAQVVDLLLQHLQPVVGGEDRLAAPLQLGDAPVAAGHVDVVVAHHRHGVVRRALLLEHPGAPVDGAQPVVDLEQLALEAGELGVDLGHGLLVGEADDAALLATAVGAASAAAGLARLGDPEAGPVEAGGGLDAEGVARRLGDVLLDPAREGRVLEEQLAGDPLGVGGAGVGQVEVDALEGEPGAQAQPVDGAREVREPLDRHQHGAGGAAQHGLDGGAPARLLGGHVEQLGDVGQLLGRHPRGAGDLGSQLVQVGGDSAGAALERGPLAAQRGLLLLQRHQRVAHLVALGAQPGAGAVAGSQLLARVQLQGREARGRVERGVEVGGRLGGVVGETDERVDALLELGQPRRALRADRPLVVDLGGQRLQVAAAGVAVGVLGGLEVGDQRGLGRAGPGQRLRGGGPLVAVGLDRRLDEAAVGAQQPQPQRRVAGGRHPVGVELGQAVRGGLAALVQPGDRLEQRQLLLLGAHRGVRGVEVVEVLDRAVGGGVRRRALEHHVLVELVDAAHLVAGLDAGQQPQRLGPVAAGADAEAGVQHLGVLRVGAVHPHPGVELLEGVGVEALGDRDLERGQVERALVADQLHLHLAGAGGAARHVVGAQRGEGAAAVVDERHRDRAPGVDPAPAQQLLDRSPGAGVVDHVDRTAQVGQQVALARAARPAADRVVGGAVELGVRGHHQRRVGVEDGGLPDAGGTRDHRRVTAERHRGQPGEAAPVDHLQQPRAPLHGVVARGGDHLVLEEAAALVDLLGLVDGHAHWPPVGAGSNRSSSASGTGCSRLLARCSDSRSCWSTSSGSSGSTASLTS